MKEEDGVCDEGQEGGKTGIKRVVWAREEGGVNDEGQGGRETGRERKRESMMRVREGGKKE